MSAPQNADRVPPPERDPLDEALAETFPASDPIAISSEREDPKPDSSKQPD